MTGQSKWPPNTGTHPWKPERTGGKRKYGEGARHFLLSAKGWRQCGQLGWLGHSASSARQRCTRLVPTPQIALHEGWEWAQSENVHSLLPEPPPGCCGQHGAPRAPLTGQGWSQLLLESLFPWLVSHPPLLPREPGSQCPPSPRSLRCKCSPGRRVAAAAQGSPHFLHTHPVPHAPPLSALRGVNEGPFPVPTHSPPPSVGGDPRALHSVWTGGCGALAGGEAAGRLAPGRVSDLSRRRLWTTD